MALERIQQRAAQKDGLVKVGDATVETSLWQLPDVMSHARCLNTSKMRLGKVGQKFSTQGEAF